MNLFLLGAAPLAAVIFHRLFFPNRPAFAGGKPWILGSIWGTLSLLAVAPLGAIREFDGNLWTVALGLTLTDVILVPGIVILVWCLTSKTRDPWELGLWLALLFSLAGVRDVAATTQVYDVNEYFLVPLQRLLLVGLTPFLVTRALAAQKPALRVLGWTEVCLLVLTGPLFQVLSWAGWSWLVAAALVGGLGASLWWLKKTAPEWSGN